MLTGSLVAIVTPMHADGSIDYDQYKQLIDWHIESGTDAIVAVGTTGESATLSVDEHLNVIKTAVEHVAGRIKVIAGTGANNTHEAIYLAREAQQAGADMTLSVVPYYNKPNQEGIYRHFKTIAEATSIPMILYNVPGRTVADMQPDTALRLAQIDNIVGIKEATGNIGRACYLFKHVPENFAVYSGDDPTAMAFLLCGGHGVISVTANVAPKMFADMCHAALRGDIAGARSLNDKLQRLHGDLFCEPSPAPTKWALSRIGKISPVCRLPITELTEAGQATVTAAMHEAGLI
ncbi:4-hydroxy-tetrahydrodipicolinate synthase [Snodgrassella alvi]|uniref:4-hydroxy-tetrahydrodipicolinate synthase n=1 Tax=Snodgrassella alvi TaxID=1196083 RepID=UPI000C1EE681|nr:4-hydroxy-tetrahydrodipicolinate synthase [Snodgrassella alvi]PIT37527.1 4-hydroxy-tetrahydrodipicolinate synthase [Snodgrassella alvi]PIT42764.1 4-hydroxy-tetrahydrodipicolinate synthase [Snodgrassella alvi]